MKVLIVGAVAGGATAAARLRRLDEKIQIVMIDQGAYVSYANCGLPYYIGGTIKERNKLFLQTPTSFGTRFNVDARIHNKALSIDREKKEVTIQNLQSGEIYQESYDKLILSTGAKPIFPKIEGISHQSVFVLRTVEDTDKIKQFIDNNVVTSAAVVGGGLIGLEMVENLRQRNIAVCLIDKQKQVLPSLDYTMASSLSEHLDDKGVKQILGVEVKAFTHQEKQTQITLSDGQKIAVQIVIVAIGIQPETELAKKADLAVDAKNYLVVDSFLRTSDKNIYALGDMIAYQHRISEIVEPINLAGPANKQGRLVANNIVFDNKYAYKGVVGTAIAKVFDLSVANTGLSAAALKNRSIPFISSITHSVSHAGYYPNSLPLSIKLNFDPQTGRLYGAQVVGYQGVDKRIDMLSTVVYNHGTVFDLTEIEHAYAPPFSSAKDPVNIAGFAAENIVLDLLKNIPCHKLWADRDKYTILDVRTAAEVKLGTIEGAIHIPVDELRKRMNELPSDKPVVCYCAVGLRAYVAARILLQNNFEAINLSGGYKTFAATEKMFKGKFNV